MNVFYINQTFGREECNFKGLKGDFSTRIQWLEKCYTTQNKELTKHSSNFEE
jgi:hypothetical protein